MQFPQKFPLYLFQPDCSVSICNYLPELVLSLLNHVSSLWNVTCDLNLNTDLNRQVFGK